MNITSPSVVTGMLLAGKYRVDRLLGEGGMGIVVAATNEALRQRVAIKLLRSGALANAKALGRFEREARAAASLRSEHVARVLDVGELDDGRPYMVMEYLEGRDLGDVIDNGPPLPVGEVVDYVLQACEAVAEAHAAGIVHRDLKPKNLYLATTVDGRPLIKVLDFGISKMEDCAEDMSLTRTTEIIGSPSYMSPEQLHSSKDVDVRTDIWALGVILYELLTKKVPFQAMTVTQLVAVVLTEPAPDVRVLRPDVPPGLALAITQCLAKKREDRFPSISSLVQAIAHAGTGALATMVERIYRVSQGSGRLPPTTASGPYTALSPAAAAAAVAPPPVASAALTAGMPSSEVSGPHRPPPQLLQQQQHLQQYGSGSLPPASPSGLPVAGGEARPPTSSARLAIHGGTSVAWGETQVDKVPLAPRPRSKMPMILAAMGLFVLAGGAAGGAAVYIKRANATQTPTLLPPPAAESVNLPEGRKSLVPVPSASVAALPGSMPTSIVIEAPTTLPSTRVPIADQHPVQVLPTPKPPGTKPPKPPVASTAIAQPPVPPPPSGKPPNDLADIGRR